MIPKIIHQVWAGHDPIPYRYRDHIETWKAHHPGWEYRLWTPTEIDDLEMVNRDLYDRARVEAPNDWLRWRADIVRLEVAYQYGGIYADTDAECLKPFDPLLDRACWFAESPNAYGKVTQSVFGTEPGHPFLKLLLAEMGQSVADYRGKRIVESVGPGFIQRMRERHDEVEMLPWNWFAGRSIDGARNDRTPDLSEAYCWHKYDNLGQKNLPDTKKVIDVFRIAADRLNASGIPWFITYGLMLGHIREGRILPWDGDLDIGIWPEDMDTAVSLFPDAQVKRQTERQFKAVLQGVKLDIHSYYRDGDTVSNYLGKQGKIRYDHPAHLFDNAQPSIFYSRNVTIPSPPEEYLETRYGVDWLTPKKVWQWNRDPKNMVFL